MGFLEERALAEKALAHKAGGPPAPFPPTAARFLRARERLGLSAGQVAERWGHQPSQYWDLESCNSEVFTCIDLGGLPGLAEALGTSPMALLFGEEPSAPIEPVDYAVLSAAIGRRLSEEGITLDELGNEVGWELRPIMEDPEALSTYNLAGVYDLCHGVGVDWVGIVVEASSKARRTRGCT